MSTSINMVLGGGAGYEVMHRGGCVLIKGAVPASAFSAFAKMVPKKSVLSSDVARLLGVTFAMGLSADLDKLREAAIPQALLRERANNPGLSDAAVKWLATGERGLSSDVMFEVLTGEPRGLQSSAHPHDPDDFRRCRLLLEQVPELQLDDMKQVSPQWANLVAVWPQICAAMDQELGLNWQNPKPGAKAMATYGLIKIAIESAPNSPA